MRGSANWHKPRRRVAKVHTKVRNQRADFLHQLSTRLVRRYDSIYTESLNVKGMVRRRPAAEHHRLAQAISDAGWSAFVGMLAYKAGWYGKEVVQIDRWYPSSKTCSDCGHTLETLPLGVRCWTCPQCEAEHQRDVNAAKSIHGVGQTLRACGVGVRPALALVNGASD